MYHLKRPGIWSSSNNILFLYQSVECLFDEHLQKQLKNDGNMSSNSSTSITTPCSSISPNSAIIPINRLSQPIGNNNNNALNSLEKINKTRNEPLYDNANLISTHTLPLSSQNNLNKKICGESDRKALKFNKATLPIGKRNAAMLLVNSVLTKSQNFKRAFLASVTHSHGNNITENNIADTATVIQKDLNV